MTPTPKNQTTESARQRFTALAKKHPVPDITGINPYRFSLDGGGRELIIALIQQTNAKLLIEIGSFLGGSTIQWLESDPKLTVIGIDPWTGDWATTLERYLTVSYADAVFRHIADRAEFIESVRTNGPFKSACANLASFGKRFLPIQGSSPGALEVVYAAGIRPDIIYIDANKISADLTAAHRLFPDARLCGDDWSWGADQGYPMQQVVTEFARETGMTIEAVRATWVLQPRTVDTTSG